MNKGYKHTWEQAVDWLRNQPEKYQLIRDCFYDDPPLESATRYYNSTEWSAINQLLEPLPKGKILDIGAGRGISSFAFASDGWEVTALEPDNSDIVGTGVIKQLQQPGINIEVIEDYGEEIPFEKETFDLVYGRAVLHHAADLKVFLKEVSRVLKKNGRFLFTREHVLSKSDDLDAFLQSHPLHHLYGGECAYLLKEYCDAIKRAGLRSEKILAPCQSDINLFPVSQAELFPRWRGKTRIPWPDWFLREFVVPVKDYINDTPGRLYSFYGSKI